MMPRLARLVVVPAAVSVLVACGDGGSRPGLRHSLYPAARTVAAADDSHDTPVADPYRWLEDTDSAETQAWIAAENALTEDFLAQVSGRAALRDRLAGLWGYRRWDGLFEAGGRYFYFHNAGLQPQDVLCTAPSLEAEPRILLDPNLFSGDGTVAVSGLSVSEDGRTLAYALSEGGSDWMEWHVREVDSGADRRDVVRWSKFSEATWAADGSGFYYGRYDEPGVGAELLDANRRQRLFFHRLGTEQAEDRLVFERPDQESWSFGAKLSSDGRFLVIPAYVGTDERNLVFYLDLAAGGGDVVELVGALEAAYEFIDSDGTSLLFRTTMSAPRGRVVAIDTLAPEPERWREVIGESADTLESVVLAGETLVCSYLADATAAVRTVPLRGSQPRDVVLPGIGSIADLRGSRTRGEAFFSFSSFTTPDTVMRLDTSTGEASPVFSPELGAVGASLVTEQVFYTSRDGTRVPMFLTHRKGLPHNGRNPVLLHGYGGFNIPMRPFFSVPNLVWLEMGGVYAQACLRGGGEYGESWHRAGMKEHKQVVFDDFIAAAEWLIASRVTSPGKLAISGASNGGLLIGAVLNQRPELFAAALPAVGVMDMLRFHRFTIGWAWTSEFGSPDDPEMFPVLRAYSPLHNIRAGAAYPATLITTADHDDRVVPGHSFKYAASMQAAQGGAAPILLRVETRAGHGAGKPVGKQIDEAADELAFLVAALDLTVPRW